MNNSSEIDVAHDTQTVAAQKGKTDWSAIRLAYIHGHKTLAQVAQDFGVTASAAEKRSEREGWSELRRIASENVSRAATERIETERTRELSAWNEADLRVARAMRGQIVAAINNAATTAQPLKPAEIRSLASAAEAVQKIGRLALGATTDNTGLSDPNGGPIPLTNVPVSEYLKARAQVLLDY